MDLWLGISHYSNRLMTWSNNLAVTPCLMDSHMQAMRRCLYQIHPQTIPRGRITRVTSCGECTSRCTRATRWLTWFRISCELQCELTCCKRSAAWSESGSKRSWSESGSKRFWWCDISIDSSKTSIQSRLKHSQISQGWQSLSGFTNHIIIVLCRFRGVSLVPPKCIFDVDINLHI